MEFFMDWKFWIFIVSMFQTGLMVYGFVIIKYNDFKHLGKDVSEMKKDVKEINGKVQKIDKITAVHEQRLNDL